MKAVTPYLFFNGNCRQALEFYKNALGGELNIMTYGDASKDACAEKTPAQMKDKVMHGNLMRGNFGLMAADSTEGSTMGDNVYLCINCESDVEIEALFQSLGEKGKVEMPLADTFWGAKFGTLTDQFGVHWMFNFQRRSDNADAS